MSDSHRSERKKYKRQHSQLREGDILIWRNNDWEPSSIITEITRAINKLSMEPMGSVSVDETTYNERVAALEKKFNDLQNELYI